MYNKRGKCNSYKSKRCNKGVSNNRKNIAIGTCTRAFNLLAVALLIQHVVCVVQAREYVSVSATTATSPQVPAKTSPLSLSLSVTPTVVLAKRYVDGNENNPQTGSGFGSRFTVRHLIDDDMDFVGYRNDFNMQAEAAIPEDIFDQQHIQDVDDIDANSMQYVGKGHKDDAAEAEADIIFSVQKFSTSESSEKEEYLEESKKNVDNKSSINIKKSEYFRRNVGGRNDKLRNNAHNHDNSNSKSVDKKSEHDNTSIYTDQMGELDVLDIENEQPLAFRSTSETKSFILTRLPKEKQNHKLIAEYEKSAEEQDGDMTRQQQPFIENLIAEKFNKSTGQIVNNEGKVSNNIHNNTSKNNANVDDYDAADKQSQSIKEGTIRKDNNMSKEVNNKSEIEYADLNRAPEMPIGDIEEKFRSEDEEEMQQQRQKNPVKSTALHAEANDGGCDEMLPAFLAKVKDKDDPQKMIKIKRNERASNGNAENDMSKSNMDSNRRRYHGRELGDYNGDTFEQIKVAEKVNIPQNLRNPQHVAIVSDFNDGGTSIIEVEPQSDHSITYFGILKNSSKKHRKLFEEEQAKENEFGRESSAKTTDIIAKIAVSDGTTEVGSVHPTRNQQKQLQKPPLSAEAAHTGEPHSTQSSTFERYKAQRRNNRLYGHKIHKKKYKDYLRHAPLPSLTAKAMTTVTEVVTTTKPDLSTALSAIKNAISTSAKDTINSTQAKLTNKSYADYYLNEEEQQQQTVANIAYNKEQKHTEKLKKYGEYVHGLPAPPIFSVGNRSVFAVDVTNKSQSSGGPNHFYEGQINYYLETTNDENPGNATVEENNDKFKDVQRKDRERTVTNMSREQMERLRSHERSMENMIAADNNNWYRRVSPVLRNGIKVLSSEGKLQHEVTASQLPLEQKHQYHEHEQRHNTAQQRTHHHRRTHFDAHQQHHNQHSQAHIQQFQHSELQRRDRERHTLLHYNHRKHRQHGKHHQSNSTRQLQQTHQGNTYKRRVFNNGLNPPSPHAADTETAVKSGLVQTPIPPSSYQQQTERGSTDLNANQLGHQITDLEEFERYYAKWPHLTQIQLQVYGEHYREAHPELFPLDEAADEEYDDDYESAAELEEAQNGRDEDANLPPYIKKYNRRNKQLLNLLEGTLPPPTRPSPTAWSSSILQPGPHASSRSGGNAMGSIRIDDDYLKEKRKRYQVRDDSKSRSTIKGSDNNHKEYRNHYQDIFSHQKQLSLTNAESSGNVTFKTLQNKDDKSDDISVLQTASESNNQLPDEDLSIATDFDIDTHSVDDDDNIDIWRKEIENKANSYELTGNTQTGWKIEKLTTPKPLAYHHYSAAVPSTPKALIFRLPSYPAIAGNFIGKPRSRSAQFAPSGGSRGKLAFVAPVGSDIHINRWSNIYSFDGGNVANIEDRVGINGFRNYHKSLSRFSAYKPNVHKTLTFTPASSVLTPTTIADINGTEGDGPLAAIADAVTVTPSSVNNDDEDGADGGTANGGLERTIKSFIYHRVMDASPRLVGTGDMGRKQRLPFVAITDRRLETTKKLTLEQQKDFEHYHYPMP